MFKIKVTCEETSSISPKCTARIGELKTGHGTVQTPAFMPVATKGYVKTVTPVELIEMGTEVLIANSFLLYLRPGLEVINDAGGLHRFMNWSKAIFTDSGGFQMIRPDFHAKVDSQGITFRSPFDGTKHLFTPEKCLEVQVGLGVDVAMMLDHCPAYGSEPEQIKSATERTTEWARRTVEHLSQMNEQYTGKLPRVFGIAQGGLDAGMREWSAKTITELDLSGFAIGGLSIGEPKSVMYEILKHQVPIFPEDRPRYLMGVGSPEDILESISLGVDIFDSVFPTRNARHGTVHTSTGNININRAPYAKQFQLLDEGCQCTTCRAGFTRAYINHLLRNYSILGMRLATIHNLHFIQNLLTAARVRLKEGGFTEFKREFLSRFKNLNNEI